MEIHTVGTTHPPRKRLPSSHRQTDLKVELSEYLGELTVLSFDSERDKSLSVNQSSASKNMGLGVNKPCYVSTVHTSMK